MKLCCPNAADMTTEKWGSTSLTANLTLAGNRRPVFELRTSPDLRSRFLFSMSSTCFEDLFDSIDRVPEIYRLIARTSVMMSAGRVPLGQLPLSEEISFCD